MPAQLRAALKSSWWYSITCALTARRRIITSAFHFDFADERLPEVEGKRRCGAGALGTDRRASAARRAAVRRSRLHPRSFPGGVPACLATFARFPVRCCWPARWRSEANPRRVFHCSGIVRPGSARPRTSKRAKQRDGFHLQTEPWHRPFQQRRRTPAIQGQALRAVAEFTQGRGLGRTPGWPTASATTG